MKVNISKISPVFGVQRVRQAAEYYRDILGFALDPIDGVFQPSEDEPDGVYAIVKKGDVWIHLQIRRVEMPQRSREKFERDVYLYVDNVAEIHADLKLRGANVVQPLCDAAYGIREFVIEDLNGFRIAFGQQIH